MDIQDYFTRLNCDSKSVFEKSLSHKEKLGNLHYLSSCIYEFSKLVCDLQEKEIIETVSAQLESSNYSLIIGLYRQAFSSMRLALEMGLAAIYFSSNKLEMQEWLDNSIDIKWSKLIDEENGVLSSRFVNAFFVEIKGDVKKYRKKAIFIYRKLSEYVHGNNETWKEDSIKIAYNEECFDKYCECYKSVVEVILFSAICRYAKFFNDAERDSLQFIAEELDHIPEIRELFNSL